MCLWIICRPSGCDDKVWSQGMVQRFNLTHKMTKQNLMYPFGSLKCKTFQVFQQDMELCLMSSIFHCHVTMLVYLIYPRCTVCFVYPDVWVCGVLHVSLHSSCSLHHSAPRQMLGTWKVNTYIMLHVEDMEEVIFGITLKSDTVDGINPAPPGMYKTL